MTITHISIQINPKKLLKSKWTAVAPINIEKHFMVTKLQFPKLAYAPIALVEIEAVLSKRVQVIHWRELTNTTIWQQCWQ